MGLIGDADRPAYLVGRAAHKRILEGLDAYDRGFTREKRMGFTWGRGPRLPR